MSFLLSKNKTAVSFWRLLGAFASFLGPYLIVLILTRSIGLYASLLGLLSASLGLLIYTYRCPIETKHDIICPLPTARKRAYLHGMLTWLLAFPLAAGIGHLAGYLIGVPSTNQLIAQQILALKPYPFLLSLTAITIVFVIPAIEELLFRGFLQNYLKNKMPRGAAILTTAILFTAVHYESSLGLANVEILTGLFILAIFLGYIYEKKGHILAPIALHQTFNAISLIALLLFE